MTADSGWAVGVGGAVGILSWVVGLGKLVWPSHPQWAVFLITIGVAIVCMVVFERSERHSTRLAHP